MERNKDLIVNILIVFFAFAVTFLLLEGFFRIYLGSNLSYEYHNSSWFLEPDQRGFTLANGKLATINEHGFRGDYDQNKPQILFLGDSFTFGYCLRDNETLAYHVEQELKQDHACSMEVLNGGVPGYGVYHMTTLYEKKFADYPADYVVLNLIPEDVYRQPSANPYAERRMFARKLIRSSSFIAFMKPRLKIFRNLITGEDRIADNYEEYLQRDQERIRRFDDRLEAENKTLILNPWIYGANQTDFYYDMRRFAEQENIPLLENPYPQVVESYNGEKEDLYCSDGHASGTHTQRFADMLADQLYGQVQDVCAAPSVNGSLSS